jgi:hypothetical protein
MDNPYLNSKFYNFMADASDGNTDHTNSTINTANTVNADATVNINHPKLNVSFPATALNNLAAAASVAGGGGLALKVMQQVPGGPGVKAVAGVATMVTAQALTIGVGKILNKNDTPSNTKNLLEFYNSNTYVLERSNDKLNIITNYSEQFNNFPLNLIPEINQLVTAELMFLFIILNIFIVKYINTIEFSKYITRYAPNKVGYLLIMLINRYKMM